MPTTQQLDSLIEAVDRYKIAVNAPPHAHHGDDVELAEERLLMAVREVAGNPIIDRIKGFGIDADRLHAAMEYKDNWGSMIHSFEYLTVLGVVEEEMLKRAKQEE